MCCNGRKRIWHTTHFKVVSARSYGSWSLLRRLFFFVRSFVHRREHRLWVCAKGCWRRAKACDGVATVTPVRVLFCEPDIFGAFFGKKENMRGLQPRKQKAGDRDTRPKQAMKKQSLCGHKGIATIVRRHHA
ncbi:hypothetical protein TW95_gp1086 [Pandoravirus inopinatum]|uniref:Uncharacterized protein n=1 Tax=Pandoravirus inopinatum TaxID=1605721 RepID=A0A0B5J7G4_9VIRU|nr:hypothetical protein TW95_gp1086 [Pandoravirus inopinatum]AJF97820.1 hypothetical protein [Pandoravirus inopinatum]